MGCPSLIKEKPMDTVVKGSEGVQMDEAAAYGHHESPHVHQLDRSIRALAALQADFGRGVHLLELLRIIRQPGWTSVADLAFVNTILDHITVQVRVVERLQADLVDAARKVSTQG
jgi:hypothetical protein